MLTYWLENASVNVWVLFSFIAREFTHFVVLISSLSHVPVRDISPSSLIYSRENTRALTHLNSSGSNVHKMEFVTSSASSP